MGGTWYCNLHVEQNRSFRKDLMRLGPDAVDVILGITLMFTFMFSVIFYFLYYFPFYTVMATILYHNFDRGCPFNQKWKSRPELYVNIILFLWCYSRFLIFSPNCVVN